MNRVNRSMWTSKYENVLDSYIFCSVYPPLLFNPSHKSSSHTYRPVCENNRIELKFEANILVY